MRGGSSKWTFTTGLYVDSSPAISGDGLTVFVGSEDSGVSVVCAVLYFTWGWIEGVVVKCRRTPNTPPCR